MDIASATTLFEALASQKRLLILRLLLKGEVAVGDLMEPVGLSQSALSQHLAILRAARLVDTRRERQNIYYACRSEVVRAVLAAAGLEEAP